MIFATDLDGTLIYSHRLVDSEIGFTAVEKYNGKDITYMTDSSLRMLKFLMNRICVIPITTRSTEQFYRVKPFISSKYAVTTNGGTIFKDGKVQKDWDNYIRKVLKNYDFSKALETFKKFPELTLQPRTVDGKFVFAKSKNIDLCKQILEYKLDTKMWQFSFHREKIYAIPKEISKGNALKYICEHLINNSQLVIAAGDSILDLSMLEYADYGIAPTNCKIFSETNLIKVEAGMTAADEILKTVISFIDL